MTKVLSQILKYSLLPAALMIVSKVLGLYMAGAFFDIPITIDNELNHIFTVQIVTNTLEHRLLLNSYSNLLVLITMGISTGYIFVRYHLLSKASSNPRTVVKIAKLNMLKWVTDSDVGIIRFFTWTMFLLSSAGIIVISSLSGKTYGWIGVTAFVSIIFFAWQLIRYAAYEVEKVYPSSGNALY